MLKYKNNLTLSKGGLDIGLKVGILAEIGYMLHECAVVKCDYISLELFCHVSMHLYVRMKEGYSNDMVESPHPLVINILLFS